MECDRSGRGADGTDVLGQRDLAGNKISITGLSQHLAGMQQGWDSLTALTLLSRGVPTQAGHAERTQCLCVTLLGTITVNPSGKLSKHHIPCRLIPCSSHPSERQEPWSREPFPKKS